MQNWIKNLGFALLGGVLAGGGVLWWKNRFPGTNQAQNFYQPETSNPNGSAAPTAPKSSFSQDIEENIKKETKLPGQESSGQEYYKGKPVFQGKQGGKYYINSKGKKTYIRD